MERKGQKAIADKAEMAAQGVLDMAIGRQPPETSPEKRKRKASQSVNIDDDSESAPVAKKPKTDIFECVP